MGRTRVPPAVRAAAMADLHAGEQPAVVAERHGLDREVVKKWKQRLSPAVSPSSPVSPPLVRPTVEAQQRQIGALVLDLLAAKLEASAAIARAAADPLWLRQQSGSELAALGQWLDATALAIGDRLASRAAAGGPGADPAE